MRAATPPDGAHFLDLERRRTQALVHRDRPVLEALHAAEYELITPAGQRWRRDAYLQAVIDAPFYTGWLIDDFRARITPAMAALRYRATLSFPSGPTLHCCHTDLYECRDDRWQAVWSQATEIQARPNGHAAPP